MFRRLGRVSDPLTFLHLSIRWQSTSSQRSSVPLRPITALYGNNTYRLESFLAMKGHTLYEPLPLSEGNEPSMATKEAIVSDETANAVPKRRKHVNKYMNPLGENIPQSISPAFQPKGEKGRPIYTIKPTLRYPLLQNWGMKTALSEQSHVTARKQQYLNVKAPEMLIFEVTELGSAEERTEKGGVVPPLTSTSPAKPIPTIVETHHVAVFRDGTVVGFGLNDAALRRIRSEVFDPYSEPKDIMLTADQEVIRLAARTNLCVFPAMAGDEAEMMRNQSERQSSSSTEGKNGASSFRSTENTKFPSTRKRIQNIIPTSAVAIDRLAKGSSGTDISLRYRFTTSEDIININAENNNKSAMSADTPFSNSDQYTQVAKTSYVDDRTLEAVVLSENTASAILPFAFCFYELIQLRAFNALVFPIHERVSQWQLHVAEKGTLPMSLKQARVMKAKLMRISSRHSKMTARRHRLLWEEHHTAARQVFEAAAEHFELSARNEGFKRRTDGVQSSLAYLCDQAHHQKDVILEWVIIALITVEVYIAIKTHSHDYDDEEVPTASLA